LALPFAPLDRSTAIFVNLRVSNCYPICYRIYRAIAALGLSDNREFAGRDLGVVIFERNPAMRAVTQIVTQPRFIVEKPRIFANSC
jgi:hypothetical protein